MRCSSASLSIADEISGDIEAYLGRSRDRVQHLARVEADNAANLDPHRAADDTRPSRVRQHFMTDPAAQVPPQLNPARRWPWMVLIGALIIAFVVNALAAVHGKSSTFDEPVHTMSSWMIVNDGDFRVNPEHPALWKYVAGLGLWGQPLKVQYDSPLALSVFDRLEQQWWWCVDTMYRDHTAPPLYGERLVWRARVAMTTFSVLLTLVVARWSWAWGGPVAAVITVALLTFDPNFLAHGALVTNDVAAAFLIALATFLAWRLGERFTWRRAAYFALACAAGLGIKFTCLLLAPMLGIPLFVRALGSTPWSIGEVSSQRTVARRLPRVGMVVGVCLASILIGWMSLWPMYLFRNAPTPSGDRFGDGYVRSLLAYNALIYERRNEPNLDTRTDARIKEDVKTWRPGPMAATLLWINRAHLVPQAWGFGINYANARSYTRASFLLGEYSDHGFWAFFPLAILFKTPVMTLAIVLASAVAGLSLSVQRLGDPRARWKLVCLIVPPLVYFAAAMSSTLNIGLRHVLPVYVPVFVACGVTMARLASRWKPARVIVPASLCLLAVETTSVFPNYLTFFNAVSVAGQPHGGLQLLSDSNLDWGQDLPALAEWYRGWHAANPGQPFYLTYYGSADPRAYGIDFINTVPGYIFDSTPPTADVSGGVLAVSASLLQGLYPEELRPWMRNLREQRPIAVINDTIYIYALGPVNPAPSLTPATTRPAP
jgi:uncharacterized membrane protein YhaH (DUF805 family)